MADSGQSSKSRQPPEQQSMDEKAEEAPADPWDTADKYLNYFVGAVALIERLGNGLGTLAFTWATVVVLGGFSTDLGKDFWYATAIVFLEGFRIFSRENRSDDELLFKTTGSISLKRMKLSRSIPYFLTVSIVIICMYGTLEFTLKYTHKAYYNPPSEHVKLQYHILLLAFLLALASVAQAPTAAQYLKDNAWLQFLSALVAVLALFAAMFWTHTPKHEVLLIIPPLLIGSLQSVFHGIGGFLLRRQSSRWGDLNPLLKTLVSLILPAWIVISVLIEFETMGVLILLGTMLLANIQIPMAVARVVLSAVRLSSKDSSRHGTSNEHLIPALTIFYSMVLAQGVFYLVACILESLLSSHFRRSLARNCKLLDKQWYESIKAYYDYTYSKRMQEGVLAQEDMDLSNFVLNSLDSNSKEKKLAAVQILDTLLSLRGNSYAKLVSDITNSTKVVTTLIYMLGPATPDEKDENKGIRIRYFTTKVIASLAKELRIVAVPGTMQTISTLLDHTGSKKEKEKQDISNDISYKNEFNTNDNQQQSLASSTVLNIQGEHGHHARTYGRFEGSNKTQRSNVKSSFNWISYLLDDLPDGDEPSKDIDWFPMQGMLILEKLAHDLENCGEINKAIGLIPKIVGFIINSADTSQNIMTSSLNLIARLVITEGEMGKKYRERIFNQHLFFSHLVEILVDNDIHTAQWKPTMVIIAKIIILEDSNHEIEKLCVIIPNLVHAFLGPNESSDKNLDHHTMQTLAGEALSKLVEKNIGICKTIFDEKGYGLIGDLKNMLQQDEYTHMAARLLMSFCMHCQKELLDQSPIEQLSSILAVVLDKILYAENERLEALIVNVSHLHSLIPGQFAHELELRTDKEKLVQKLVGALNSNKKICNQFPRMRRVIIEITLSIVQACPHYSPIFQSNGMIEALSKVEKILAKVEKYKAFLGHDNNDYYNDLPPSDQVTRAKQLIGS